MYNSTAINELIKTVTENDGISDKNILAGVVQEKFNLIKDRSVYYCSDFSIRFSKSKSRNMSNTVLALSVLQKYDSKPFILCIVTEKRNFLLLANTTFLKKISHSSHELRENNIRGSFNGSDIVKDFDSLENSPENFSHLYAFHSEFSFEDNLRRLAESTNEIVGRNIKTELTDQDINKIFQSVDRASEFINSEEYIDLKQDLDNRVSKVQGEIAIAAFITNQNIRGRVIEYLITDNGSTLKEQIIKALRNEAPLPQFKTDDNLGDYSKIYAKYSTETDIKTKIMFLNGNPKAYNIDKFLKFLSKDKSVYMLYILGVDENKNIVARLCSVFDSRLIKATSIQPLWAGRNTRGVTQFYGAALSQILNEKNSSNIDAKCSIGFLQKLIDL